jgi:hypothetical protein
MRDLWLLRVFAVLLTVTVIPGTPSAPAVVTMCARWWALTIRGDLARSRDGDREYGELKRNASGGASGSRMTRPPHP